MKTGDSQELEPGLVEAHMWRVRGLRPRSPDLPAPPDGRGSPRLSREQLRFARRHGASAGAKSTVSEAVFFYRSGEHGTERWLVNSEGQVLDNTFLR
jgi:hypothetical protein